MKLEEELISRLIRDGISVTHEASADRYFDSLERRYPVVGSKIDWDRVPSAYVVREDPQDWDRYLDASRSFFRRVMAENSLSGAIDVVVIGDSAMDGALTMSLGSVLECLEKLLEMPQHTYVLAPDAEWTIVLTMEGEMAFVTAAAN